jgi:hypothetical protein
MAPPFKVVGGNKGYHRLPERTRGANEAALGVLAVARREKLSIREAAEREGSRYGTVMRYIGTATHKDAFGRTVPDRADRLFRHMEILAADGSRQMRAVYGSRAASDIGRHQAAVGRFLETGDESLLAPFRGVRRAGVELAADPDVIEAAARRGMLDDLAPYAHGTR